MPVYGAGGSDLQWNEGFLIFHSKVKSCGLSVHLWSMNTTWLRYRNHNHTYAAYCCYMLESIYENAWLMLTVVCFHDFKDLWRNIMWYLEKHNWSIILHDSLHDNRYYTEIVPAGPFNLIQSEACKVSINRHCFLLSCMSEFYYSPQVGTLQSWIITKVTIPPANQFWMTNIQACIKLGNSPVH